MSIISKVTSFKRKSKEKTERKIIFLPTGDMIPNPFRVRSSSGNVTLKKLADSIQRYGIIQPIIIRKRDNVPFVEIGEEKVYGEKYEIVAGERRWRAAIMLNLNEVPCILIDSTAKEGLEISLAENIQRDPLHFLEEAEGASILINDFDSDAAEAAEALSITKPSLMNRFNIMQLTECEKKVIMKSGLSERHATAISKIEDREKRFRLIEQAVSTSMSAPETENAALGMINPTFRTKGDTKRKIAIMPDVGFFLNSLNRAIVILENAGIKVDKTELESEGILDINLKIKKRHKTK